MHRSFIAAIAALSIIITGLSAAPARADSNDDLLRALAAIAGIAVIGTAIKKRNDRREEARRRDHVGRGYQYQDTYRAPPPKLEPRPLPRRAQRDLLPGNCLRSFDTRDGRIRMFGARCLQRNYSYTDRLPQRCFREVRTRDGRRRGYEARCLRDRGYQLARR
ncbi:hypothetical protein [Sulfitobacter sabulilitoris]|uniref:Uncharacterized protein n=1 Tax=Sulfitobacter sabulilitoris TaxID=2562655 RepID=A0A5S3PEG6_9RHOB|nr:hypothetical protein [Sulfitobacter sabulilitoris]TMM52417.1 hypothetical protein FDT80_09040 [Sulfitobacter sabulilitoris]